MATDSPSQSRPTAPAGRARRNVALLVLAVLIGAGLAFWWGDSKTYHFEAVQPGVLYRSGNQGLRVFATALHRSGAKTIVSLIDDRELADPGKPQFAAEAEYAAAHGIKLVRVPVTLGGWPSTANVRAFLDTAADQADQPVLVHCAQGVRRTGMMVAAFEMSVLGYDKTKAAAAIDSFGHSDRTIADVKKFIEIYDPATRTVTQQPGPSVE